MFKHARNLYEGWKAENTTRQELQGLSDDMLEDIGVQRADISRIARDSGDLRRYGSGLV